MLYSKELSAFIRDSISLWPGLRATITTIKKSNNNNNNNNEGNNNIRILKLDEELTRIIYEIKKIVLFYS